MAGEFASFSYNGRGSRFYIVLHYNVVSHLNLAFKYGISVVADNNTIGSGYETINEPHKQTVKLQLRYQF